MGFGTWELEGYLRRGGEVRRGFCSMDHNDAQQAFDDVDWLIDEDTSLLKKIMLLIRDASALSCLPGADDDLDDEYTVDVVDAFGLSLSPPHGEDNDTAKDDLPPADDDDNIGGLPILLSTCQI